VIYPAILAHLGARADALLTAAITELLSAPAARYQRKAASAYQYAPLNPNGEDEG
jgi:hypothetical protein